MSFNNGDSKEPHLERLHRPLPLLEIFYYIYVLSVACHMSHSYFIVKKIKVQDLIFGMKETQMPDITVGDVVIRREPNGPKITGCKLFYVNNLHYGGTNLIGLTKVTSNSRSGWRSGAPAAELVVVGHIEDTPKLQTCRWFAPEDMVKFEPAREEALRQGFTLDEDWT